MLIDISKLDKAVVLAALFNHSKQQGMGVMDARGRSPITVADAATILQRQTSFDYLFGRVMKVDLSKNTFDSWGYDRDNGQGAAQAAIFQA